MEARVVLIRHNDGPADDRVVGFLRMRGVEPEFHHPSKGEPLGSPDESVAASAYLADYMRERDRFIAGIDPPPASTLMIVSGFARPDFKIEVEAIAAAAQS